MSTLPIRKAICYLSTAFASDNHVTLYYSVVECLDLSAPENGSMECTAEFEFRSTCSFTCQVSTEKKRLPVTYGHATLENVGQR